MKVFYVAMSLKYNYKHDDILGIKGVICIHERDSKRKIYVVLFGFWGLCPQTPPGLCPWTPVGDFCPPDPLSFAPQPVTAGDATVVV